MLTIYELMNYCKTCVDPVQLDWTSKALLMYHMGLEPMAGGPDVALLMTASVTRMNLSCISVDLSFSSETYYII